MFSYYTAHFNDPVGNFRFSPLVKSHKFSSGESSAFVPATTLNKFLNTDATFSLLIWWVYALDLAYSMIAVEVCGYFDLDPTS